MKRFYLLLCLLSITPNLQALERVSVDSNGDELFDVSWKSDISSDGRYVVYETDNDILPEDTNSRSDIYRYDRLTGEVLLISVNINGVAANQFSEEPQISDDGMVVAFMSNATDLTADAVSAGSRIYLRDLVAGTTVRISSTYQGGVADGKPDSFALSGDGKTIAFNSSSTDLVANDTNGEKDLFVVEAGDPSTIERISEGPGGVQANGASRYPDITPDGRYIVYQSAATNLISGGTAAGENFFRYDRDMNTTVVVTRSIANGTPSGTFSKSSISADGAMSPSCRMRRIWSPVATTAITISSSAILKRGLPRLSPEILPACKARISAVFSEGAFPPTELESFSSPIPMT